MSYPDPDTVVWQVFAPVEGAFVRMGAEPAYDTFELALVQAYEDLEQAGSAFLCSFKAGDLKLNGTTFRTLSSHRLRVNGEMIQPDRSGGPMIINLKEA
ncbi:TPA: hypothetical protein DIU27_04270 [Candidatus Collierbacteria bacterium]|uniref:Uncharacterized protein n=1 Tax=Candidatus Collierbacteria bacterium GW2011_GWB2_44_22 TaxID=1618387 RepID=A0A0G1HYP9_9BACT|nr:MAG: hypothetical protein UW31_C0013G0008 [Candidatus Collierbacteria bacterium GW2011_GWA2_44_13]KKT51688.1 MAG: hypothetical protein UW44_C0008G0010 [Candidatus Collierbacteria bacterium GW2011_GWB2_44_22]KKT62486.1 MAG: hypothetical protein UW56_C0006G0009 [Candidatus Collierbacteria bacterium GW2011_GWD1_44_27]KKT66907.1 MAG: hypothetical protein UW58_C0001G0011 [Candidatus Collierbacteria bacterium GW2011_GWC2_44_30]KKT88735.1 MAG: hypothetical protein UW88_C0008G0009 [Candidatus Collie